jgi:hypothetical protein
MIKLSKEFFVINSNPLQPVGDLQLNYRYCTADGHIIKILSVSKEKDNVSFDIVQRSELVDGELITNLSDKQLHLFWVLMKNNAVRNLPYEEDSD